MIIYVSYILCMYSHITSTCTETPGQMTWLLHRNDLLKYCPSRMANPPYFAA